MSISREDYEHIKNRIRKIVEVELCPEKRKLSIGEIENILWPMVYLGNKPNLTVDRVKGMVQEKIIELEQLRINLRLENDGYPVLQFLNKFIKEINEVENDTRSN